MKMILIQLKIEIFLFNEVIIIFLIHTYNDIKIIEKKKIRSS